MNGLVKGQAYYCFRHSCSSCPASYYDNDYGKTRCVFTKTNTLLENMGVSKDENG